MIGALIFLGFVGVGLAGTSIYVNNENANAQLELQQETADLQAEADLKAERIDILAQANNAAMQIESIGHSIKNAGFYQNQFSEEARLLTDQRNDALNMFDANADRTRGNQRVSLALSGAKLTSGSALEASAQTERALFTDRENLAVKYNSEIKKSSDTAYHYGEAISEYNSQIDSYTTLLTDIYNSNSWMKYEDLGEYGGVYGDWIKKMAEK